MGEEKCGAILLLGDDYGDNSCTFRCKLPKGHEGLHQEKFESDDSGDVVVTWEHDARVECPICGALVDGPMEMLSCEFGINWDTMEDDPGACYAEFCKECNAGDGYMKPRCPKHPLEESDEQEE